MADWRELNSLPQEELSRIKYNDPRLDSFANAVEERYGLPKDLIVAVKNAGERSNTGQVSTAGAKGVMQFIDKTRKSYEHDVNDPMASIDAAGRMFKDLLGMYKNNAMAAIAHYNGGRANGKAAMDGQPLPSQKETAPYLQRIRDYMEKRSAQQATPPPQPTASFRLGVSP
jgi:soluble lytic murein transglycosylase-like protein